MNLALKAITKSNNYNNNLLKACTDKPYRLFFIPLSTPLFVNRLLTACKTSVNKGYKYCRFVCLFNLCVIKQTNKQHSNNSNKYKQ